MSSQTESIYNYFNTDLVSDITTPNPTNSQNKQSNEPVKERETAFESKLKKFSDKAMNNHLLSGKNMSKFRDSLSVSGILDIQSANNITLRELPKISQENYDKLRNSIAKNEELEKLFNDLNK